jgi:hypothetical protein
MGPIVLTMDGEALDVELDIRAWPRSYQRKEWRGPPYPGHGDTARASGPGGRLQGSPPSARSVDLRHRASSKPVALGCVPGGRGSGAQIAS